MAHFLTWGASRPQRRPTQHHCLFTTQGPGLFWEDAFYFFCSPSRVSPRSYFFPLFPLLDVQEVSKHCFLFHTDSRGLAVLVIFPGEVQRFVVRREDVILRRLEKKDTSGVSAACCLESVNMPISLRIPSSQLNCG